MNESRPISVVIPTLGGDVLARAIERLNAGTIVPMEILICIPSEFTSGLPELPFANVRVIPTACRGQVAQRAVGFELAVHPLILQLDSDVFLLIDTLQALADALESKGPGNAVGPLYVDLATRRFVHEMGDGLSGWLQSVYASVVCGAPWGIKRMGVVTSAGVNYGVDGRFCGTEPFETQWLPGGCVLSFREDLITANFYPQAGKAFCEDVIHSALRARKGVRHWVAAKARCLIETPQFEVDSRSIEARDFARSHVVRVQGGNVWRLKTYTAISRLTRAFHSWRRGKQERAG
jgi:hypothetical protein